ncbi:unnamed protein product [Dicrocoelium dendriticum]|nr:unnamed protein product [Dicrocoelium dendriticum]
MNVNERVNISDDFDLFCQIAQPSSRESLYPSDYPRNVRSQRRESCADHSVNYPKRSEKRSSSFREIRHPAQTPQNMSGASLITARSPARSDNMHSPASLHVSRDNPQTSYRLSPKSLSTLDTVKLSPKPGTSTAGRGEDCRRPPNVLLDRARAGSMKETARKHSTAKSVYRPSAPAVYSTSLVPNFDNDPHSPSRISSKSAEEGLVKVRSFQRKKDGKIIRKGDKNLPQMEIYGPADRYRGLTLDGRKSIQGHPTILTDEASDRSDFSEGEGDVLEIPAITTTLVHPSGNDVNQEPAQAAYNEQTALSPNSLTPGFRSRSRSWAVVSDSGTESPYSHSSPPTELISPNELLTVQVLGTDRVGKTSLCLQFQTSESLDVTVDNTAEDERMRTITVEVNNHKFNLQLYDTNLMQEELICNEDSSVIESADAYVVVYAIDDRSSFLTARSIVSFLLGKCKRSSAIVLAANKSDLVRTRAVSVDEGKNLAAVYSCPFYEISTSLNHRVDEVLVGIIVAIQERRLEVNRERNRLERMASINKRGSLSSPGHRMSFGTMKSPSSGFVRFFQRYFLKKDKRPSAVL